MHACKKPSIPTFAGRIAGRLRGPRRPRLAAMGLPRSEHVEWASWNLQRFHEHMGLWEASLASGRCNYLALLHANRMLYGALINYKDAGMEEKARACEVALDHLDHFIAELMAQPRSVEACAATYDHMAHYLEI